MNKSLSNDQPDFHSSLDKQHFATYDLGLSAALICLNFELISLGRDNPRKVQFIFLRQNNLDQIVSDYFSGKLVVSARALFDNTKMLKNRIYSSVWTYAYRKKHR